MKKYIGITIVISSILGNTSIQAEETVATGFRGSMHRAWEVSKILLGSVLLIPGCGFSADGALKLKRLYHHIPTEDKAEIRLAGFELGGGLGSLAIGMALMESGFRNLREIRRHHKKSKD